MAQLERIAVAACLVLGLALVATPAAAQEEGMPEGMTEEMQAEMQAWMEAAQPGDHHQHLAMLEGSWTYTSKMWMNPSAEPMTYSGSAEKKMILGGRYLEEQTSGVIAGMGEFHGIGVHGYDNIQGKYVSSWIDSMGTMMMVSKGHCSDGGKVHEMHTAYLNPYLQQEEKARMVTRVVDADHHVFEYYVTRGGEESKVMEIEYTRQGS